MRNILLPLLCCVLLSCKEVRSQIENEIKRGVFPFMAILYYPDETVVDTTGARFQHGAVLIKPEWLLSAAIDHSVLDGIPLGFPRKTLLARMGAVTLDVNYTLNEDEDEQEREIIQIIKPSIHNKDMWWLTDITLLQTLMPFKLTSAIAPTNINPKRDYDDKNCVILVYARKIGNASEDRVLMQLSVELLPPTLDNCGPQFSDTTMTCAVPGDEMKNPLYESEFCQGNSGGPLMCEGEVMALQTYIENNCKPPHLYQLLASWDNMITCGVDEKCGVDAACNVCVAIHKDTPTETNETVLTTPIIENNSTIIQNDIITTEQPGIVTKTSSTEETGVETGVTMSSETTTLGNETTSESAAPESVSGSSESMSVTPEVISAGPEGIKPDRSETPRNETSSAEPEVERRISYMDLFNREEYTGSEKSAESSSSKTTNNSSLVETTSTEPSTTISSSSQSSPYPSPVREFPTLTDDVTPRTKVEALQHSNYRLVSRHSGANTIAIPDVLSLVILVCLV